ncbi:MAG TPA: TylF/MycF/NovP-related O-methyltransferase [Phenylobacterium sp.]|uniref:TylF/MycF/NovP-related O-methyltransferase n=1 Tax=Phenylobacterium sp. TaxID=1871053 RepID=UPI002B7211A0|nr:TylF/MycF/NovP-related O-methyltransferase [Phenylobacterium sp.]HXA40799.1 TylF/MycF/NovP-related O-methyltransferase [Phenylobacterium sp.]
MSSITLEDVTATSLQTIGDAFMMQGDHPRALEFYTLALKKGPGTYAMLTRHGLAASPTPSTEKNFRILLEVEKLDSNCFVGTGLATWHKPLPFFNDARFIGLAHKHAALLGQPNWHWSLNTVVWAVQEAKSIPGDFVELGVFRGHTTLFTAEYVDFQTWPKRWWLCDTFDGIPADQLDPGWTHMNSVMYAGTYSYEEVRARFEHIPNITVHQGRVPEALAEGCPEQIAFLHLDLNNSTAEIAALDALIDRISPGGIIILDDFGWAASRLQNEIESEWFARRGLHVLTLPTGQGLFRKPS